MNVMTPKFGVGAPVRRKEDRNLLVGAGRFADDMKGASELHGYVLRSPTANAAFTICDLEAARAAPGVKLILTAEDISDLGALASSSIQKGPKGAQPKSQDIPLLCRDRVRYVGDAVAFIVAETHAQAQDAADLVEVDYETDDAATATGTALNEGVPLVWPESGSNLAFTYHFGDKADTDAAFGKAAHVSEISFVNNRIVANYMEPRAALAEWDGERFTLTTGSQGVHSMRRILAEQVFRLPPEKIHVLTHDVGGGFGTKMFVYREYPLAMEAARRLGQPVKWTSDRTEHFLTDAHGRDNAVTAQMAMDGEGRFLGLRVKLLANMGAYISQNGGFIPYVGPTMSTGVYDIRALDLTVEGVYTHTVPVDAYRGAGRPEAAFLLEKLVDQSARDLKLDPAEIRRRNFIRPEQFPYKTVTGRNYDVGEFDGHLTTALERSGWADFDARNSQAAKRGRIRGIGLATYVEACAFAGSEAAHLKLNEDGTVTMLIGTQSNGQGHTTAYAQFVADKLDLDVAKINVEQGDSDALPKGGGTGGSRSIPLGGVSASLAGEDLAEKIRKIASDQLEAATVDIELADGAARIVGTDRSMSFAEIAQAATSDDDLKGFGEFKQAEATYPNGTHVAEVEIDPETGHAQVVAYTIVDDFGMTVNPLLLAGQVHGGVVQGLGQALTEEAVYAEDGQLMTASFMDYAVPRADDIPDIHFETRNVPSTTNAMGIKGAGEAGSIGSTPAVMNAVTDALWRAYEISHIEMPATPLRVWNAIRDAAGRDV